VTDITACTAYYCPSSKLYFTPFQLTLKLKASYLPYRVTSKTSAEIQVFIYWLILGAYFIKYMFHNLNLQGGT